MLSQDWHKHDKRLMLQVAQGGEHPPGMPEEGHAAMAHHRHLPSPSAGELCFSTKSMGMRRCFTTRLNTSARRYLT